MTRAISLLIFTIILSATTACNKEDETIPAFSYEEVYDCHQGQNYSVSGIATRLVGTWKLNHYTNPWEPGSIYYPANEVYITLTNSQFTVTEAGEDAENGNWEIKESNNTFEIVPSTSNQYVGGQVLLCEDKLILSTAYLDGPSYFFVKVD